MVMRDQKTFELIDPDRCALCGQEYIYSDLNYFKEKGW